MTQRDLNDAPTYSDNFSELDGSDLELQLFLVSHGHLRFRVTGLERGSASLLFVDTVYIDCAGQMHEIRLREASSDETAKALQELPPDQFRHLKYRKMFRIRCREGVYSIWSHGGGFCREENPEVFNHVRLDEATNGLMNNPLWKNGPPLNHL